MFIEYFLIGCSGALCLEILKVYELMGKLEKAKFLELLTWRIYWIVASAMILASGFLAWAINSGNDSATTLQLIMSGIGARTLVSKPIELPINRNATKLGNKQNSKLSIADIFR